MRQHFCVDYTEENKVSEQKEQEAKEWSVQILPYLERKKSKRSSHRILESVPCIRKLTLCPNLSVAENMFIGNNCFRWLCISGQCFDFRMRQQTVNRVVVVVNLEPLWQILVGIDKFCDLVKNNVCLVLLCRRTKYFSVLVPVEIAVITRQNTIDERFSVSVVLIAHKMFSNT